MPPPPPDSPESDPAFATTRWSMVFRANEEDDSVVALAELCRRYWYPLYSFARRKGLRVEDAEDLTQSYFERLLSKDGLKSVSPERGKFRSFLLAGMQHYMIDEWRKSSSAKRGGGHELISIDTDWAENRFEKEPKSEAEPEAYFDRGWALSIVDRVMSRLERDYDKVGKGALFERLKTCLTGENQRTYSELANETGMSEGGFTMAVQRLRKKFGGMVREEVAETLDEDEDVAEEVRWLLTVLGKTL